MGEVFEEGEACLDVGAGEVGEAVGGEGLAGEGGDDGAVDDGLAKVVEGEIGFAGGGEVTGEGAEEGIAGSGGVGDFGEGEGGAAEEVVVGAGEAEFGVDGAGGVFCEEDGAEFAEFDDDIGGAFGEESLSGDDEVGGFAEFAGFGFVDDEEVDFLEDFVEVVIGDGDPEIHGIGGDEGFFRGELLDHLELIDRVHVGEDDDGRGGGVGGDFGGPVFEDVDGDGEGIAVVHVLVVGSGPGEGVAFGAFEAVGGDAFGCEEVEVFLGEVLADDADEMDGGGEIGGGESGEGCGAAEEVFAFGSRGFDVVDGDGAADEDGSLCVGHGGGSKLQISNFKSQMGDGRRKSYGCVKLLGACDDSPLWFTPGLFLAGCCGLS